MRYRLQLTPCRINILDCCGVEVELLNSETMIANGQTVVFNDEDRLLGYGLTESAEWIKMPDGICRQFQVIPGS
jgi:tRNA U34 2-thiouridine synthase MnmA/TrmU